VRDPIVIGVGVNTALILAFAVCEARLPKWALAILFLITSAFILLAVALVIL